MDLDKARRRCRCFRHIWGVWGAKPPRKKLHFEGLFSRKIINFLMIQNLPSEVLIAIDSQFKMAATVFCAIFCEKYGNFELKPQNNWINPKKWNKRQNDREDFQSPTFFGWKWGLNKIIFFGLGNFQKIKNGVASHFYFKTFLLTISASRVSVNMWTTLNMGM